MQTCFFWNESCRFDLWKKSDFSNTFLKIPEPTPKKEWLNLMNRQLFLPHILRIFFFAPKKITHHNLGAKVFHGPKVLGANGRMRAFHLHHNQCYSFNPSTSHPDFDVTHGHVCGPNLTLRASLDLRLNDFLKKKTRRYLQFILSSELMFLKSFDGQTRSFSSRRFRDMVSVPSKTCHCRWMFPKIVVPPNYPFLIGFSIINHQFWDTTIFGNTYRCFFFKIWPPRSPSVFFFWPLAVPRSPGNRRQPATINCPMGWAFFFWDRQRMCWRQRLKCLDSEDFWDSEERFLWGSHDELMRGSTSSFFFGWRVRERFRWKHRCVFC